MGLFLEFFSNKKTRFPNFLEKLQKNQRFKKNHHKFQQKFHREFHDKDFFKNLITKIFVIFFNFRKIVRFPYSVKFLFFCLEFCTFL